MKPREITAFILCGLFWGSSFLWIKIAVADIHSTSVVAWRLLFGAVGLLVVLRVLKKRLPRDPAVWRKISLLCFLNPITPFYLIAWGETQIDSSVASILNGTSPLFTIFCAHFLLQDEKITLSRILGLLLGFAGVVVLVTRGQGTESLIRDLFASNGADAGVVWGRLAVVGAAFCYSLSTVLLRKYARNVPPLELAATMLTVSAVITWVIVLGINPPSIVPSRALTWVGLSFMGFLGSSFAFILYFYLINTWGATRAAFTNYVFPLVGLILGIVFLNEEADWSLAFGAILIVAGVLSVNIKHLTLFSARNKVVPPH